jgi:hypothetical protein
MGVAIAAGALILTFIYLGGRRDRTLDRIGTAEVSI